MFYTKGACLIIGGTIVLIGGGSIFLLMRDTPVRTDAEHQALSPNGVADTSLGGHFASACSGFSVSLQWSVGYLYRGTYAHLLPIACDVGIGRVGASDLGGSTSLMMPLTRLGSGHNAWCDFTSFSNASLMARK